jgi:hypothetical protein
VAKEIPTLKGSNYQTLSGSFSIFCLVAGGVATGYEICPLRGHSADFDLTVEYARFQPTLSGEELF